nr:MMPL family transporter [Nitrospinaceae bacterium]
MKSNTAFGEWVIRFRWRIILGTLLLVAIATAGGVFLNFSSDYRVFFSAENPQLKAFDTLQNTYTKNDNVLIALEPENGDMFTRENLAALEDLTRQAWQTPYSIRVESLTNFQHSWARGDDLVVRDLVKQAQSLTDPQLEAIRHTALTEPLLANRLISPLGHVAGINITVQLPGKSLTEVPEVADYARKLRDDFLAVHPEFKVYLTGVAMINNQFVESGQQDMMTLVPAMFAVIALLIWVVLRTLAGTLSTLLLIAISSAAAMGLAGWWGILLTPVSGNAPVYILTMAVADSIHILITLFHEMRQGKSRHSAIVESLRVNLKPVFITSVTTAIGFLSLNFSDSPPYRDLGNIVAAGVTVAFAASVTFLPALMAVLPLKAPARASGSGDAMDRFAGFVIRRRRPLFWSLLAVIIVLAVQIPRIEINDTFEKYFDHRYTFRNDVDFTSENLTGFESIEYSLRSGEPEGISRPEYLAQLEAFKDWYRQQPNVTYVGSLSDIMKRLNKNMHGDDPAFYKLPEERELAAQYLLLYEMSLPYGLDLNNQINVDKSATRFTVVFKEINTREALALEEKAQGWLKTHGLPSMQRSYGSSPLIMFSHIAMRNVKSMIAGTGWALVLISGILIVALRNFKMGLISLIPNLVPAFMAFGFWALTFREIGMAVSVVIALSLGVIVDDTVHFL